MNKFPEQVLEVDRQMLPTMPYIGAEWMIILDYIKQPKI